MSQFGADRWALHHNPNGGFYLDVGCHDGVDISNTLLLDKAGWKGICIDPFPKNFEKRTAHVVKAVVYSSNDDIIEFDYSVEDPGCSGINSELGIHKERLYTTTTIQKHKFKTRTLQSILEDCNAPYKIEYMNLDVEGAEYEVLRVFPFDRYSFKCMSIEHNYEEPKRSQIRQLLESKGYKLEHSVHVDDWYVYQNWGRNPRVIVSLTSTPPRLNKLEQVLKNLTMQICHEICVNIPKKYTRFPDWDGEIPDTLTKIHPMIRINRDCEDVGPATKFLSTALRSHPDDYIIYVDDDTLYSPRLTQWLVKWHKMDPTSAWGLSGFSFQNYFNSQFPRVHGEPVDVLEGYGGVIVKAGWIQRVADELKELVKLTWHDDLMLCNLFEKYGIQRKTIWTEECNLGRSLSQQDFGFKEDALHHVAGGSHIENNKKILKRLKDNNVYYFKYDC